MRKLIVLTMLLVLINTTTALSAETRIRMASTTSTQNSGLFDYLLPIFEKKTGIKIDVVAVGTGAAIEIGKRGDADVVFVHAKEQELKAVEEGFFVNRHDVMYNDFVVIGPSNDPAKIKSLKTTTDAFKKIAETLWVLKDKTIGVFGLAFKQNTDDVRMSPAIELCQRLLKDGASLRVHDPKAMEKAKPILPTATFVDDMNLVADDCDALVVATEWPQFKKLDLERARRVMTHPIMFDGRNLFAVDEMTRLGFIYKSIGR